MLMSKLASKGLRAWHLYLLLGTVATGGYFLLSTTGQNILYNLVGVSAAAAPVIGIFMHRPSHRLPWYLLAFAMALVAVGNIVQTVYESFLQIENAYPSMADVLYVAGSLLLVAGLLLTGPGGIGRNGTNLIDPLIVAIGAGMLWWVFFMEPRLDGPTLPLMGRLLSTVYLLLYVVVLVILLRPLFVPEKRLPALYLLCASVAVLVSADMAYGATISGTYETGSWFFVGALLWYVLFGAAALHPSIAALSDPVPDPETKLTWWRLVLLTGAMLTAPGALAVQAVLGDPINVPLIVGGSATLFLLVAIRTAGTIGERKVLERRLAFLAFHDSLTGLPNRALFMERLKQAMDRAGRQGGRVAVLFVDLDGFKDINDSLGHEAGDKLLTAVGQRLRACLRPADTVARLGGDEFAVLLEGNPDASEAIGVAKHILGKLRAPFTLERQRIVVNASIGIALSSSNSGPHNGLEDLLRKADLALYRVKSKSKGGYQVCEYKVFDPSADNRNGCREEYGAL